MYMIPDKVAPARERTTRMVSALLLIYVYMPYFWNICEYTFGVASIIEYMFLLLLCLASIFIYHKVNSKMLLFFMAFFAVLAINGAVVSYRYYVYIEGLQAFLGVLVPCACITNYYFRLSDFLSRWYKFAFLNIPLVIIAIFLLRANLAHYSIFTGICVPNVFILSYGIMQMQVKKKWALLVAVLNILVTAALGGRMAAVVCVAMLFFAYLFSKDISLWKKVFFIIFVFVLAYLFIENLNEILLWVNRLLGNYGIRSRSVTLLIEQLSSRELYTTNRDTIYSLVIDYIKDRAALPGGFGVALYLTGGEYYYVHNCFLQLLVVFGAPGALIIIAIILAKFYRLKTSISTNAFNLLIFMLLSYLLIGFTGSSFFIHYLATIFIALFFFGDNVLKNMEA